MHHARNLCVLGCRCCTWVCRLSDLEDKRLNSGFVSGVTRITVTVVVIMFELTGALTYILPLMVSIPAVPHNVAYAKTLFADHITCNESCQRLLWRRRHVRSDDLVQRISLLGKGG